MVTHRRRTCHACCRGLGTLQLLALLSACGVATALVLQAHAVLTEHHDTWAMQMEALHHLRNMTERLSFTHTPQASEEHRSLRGRPWRWACVGVPETVGRGDAETASVLWTCTAHSVTASGVGWVLTTRTSRRARAY
jgi:hypothetical protein